MKRILRRSIVTAAACSMTFGAALNVFASSDQIVLGAMQAPVMVAQDHSYVDATEGMVLSSSDRLMVMKGGSAQVHFANGCSQTYGANSINQVGTQDTCIDALAANAEPVATGTGGGLSGGTSMVPTLIAGAAIVAGIVVVKADEDDYERPGISPE